MNAKHRMVSSAAIGILMGLTAFSAIAQTAIHVDGALCTQQAVGTPDHPFCTIQEGIDAARDGDTVLVGDGTYTGDGNVDLSFGGKAITVRSVGGPDACVVTPSSGVRAFRFDSGETPDAVLEGMTITGGWSSLTGVAMLFDNGSSPTVVNCSITENEFAYYGQTPRGGGVACLAYSSPSFVNCVLSHNEARRSDTARDSYGFGGGVYAEDSSPSFVNCTISSNRSGDEGGGMYFVGSCHPSFEQCTFDGNRTARKGGGICIDGGSAMLADCTFVANLARFCVDDHDGFATDCVGSGGALYVASGGPSLIQRCAFLENQSRGEGGAIYAGSSVELSNCLLAGNHGHRGGAISGSFTATFCTIVENSTGPNSWFWGEPANSGTCGGLAGGQLLGNSILWSNTASGSPSQSCSTYIGGYNNTQSAAACTGCIHEAPLFVDAEAQDYRLAPDSPGIDAGDPNYEAGPYDLDLAGHRRVMCGRVDMGAYEYGMPGDVSCDDTTDLVDFAEWQTCMTDPGVEDDPFPLYSAACADLDQDADGDIDLVDLAAFQRSMLPTD